MMAVMALDNFLFAFEVGPAVVTSVAVIVVAADDPQGTILYATPLADDMFGYAGGTLIGRSVDDLIPVGIKRQQHAEQRRQFANESLVRTMNDGVYVDGLRTDGTIVKVQVSLCPRIIGNRPCILACLADVSRAYAHALMVGRDEGKTTADQVMESVESVPEKTAEKVIEKIKAESGINPP